MLIALLPNAVAVSDVSPRKKAGDFRFHFVLLLLAVALGLLLQVLGPRWAQTILAAAQLDSLPKLGWLLLALVASVCAHEMGHLLAASFLNYEMLGGALGPLRLELWGNKAFLRYHGGPWSRCSISAVPRELHNLWRERMLCVVAAGPAASFLLLVATARMALGGCWLPDFWSICAEVNFFLFVIGLIPNSASSAVRNDAALFRSIWRNDSDAEDLRVCHRAIELTLRRLRPNDFPEAVLRELATFSGRPYTKLLVARRMVEWALDNGHIAQADEWDRAAVEFSKNCAPRQANIALAESACFDVLFRDDFSTAAYKFSNVEFKDLFPPSLAERACAAHLLACDMPHRAPAHILRAQFHLPLGDPYFNYDRMLLDTLHTKALAHSFPRGLRQC